MRQKATLYLLLSVLVLVAGPAPAQQQQGDTELQLQGSLSLSTGGDAEDSGAVAVNWGYFFTDQQEAGVSALGVFTEDGDLGGLGGPFYRYNLSTGTTVPYVGVAASFLFGDFTQSESDVFASLEGGVRWFLERNMAFNVGATALYDVEESEFFDSVQVLFGFSYFWNR